jgi:Leucine-rich repeat (LRR) protein
MNVSNNRIRDLKQINFDKLPNLNDLDLSFNLIEDYDLGNYSLG